ncbi:MAG: AEC family transporter [Rhizobiales bacterium]|nr:AEC family transporter [Hyphomicrobiales bacterium]
MIITTISSLEIDLETHAQILLATFVSLLCFAVIGYIVLRIFSLPVRTYLGPLMHPNTGNMGLPISLFAFGQVGLSYGVTIFCANALAQFTIGPLIASGSFSLRQLLKVPFVYAMLLAVVLLVFDLELPGFLDKTFSLLGGMTIGLMLITLGVSLATFEITQFWRSLALALLRLGMGVGVGWALASLFGFEGPARGIFILLCSMPSAVFTYIIAERFNAGANNVAGVIALSTMLSFLFLPVLLVLVL